MPKLLRAVRLDDSDEHVFKGCGAAKDGEWVVTGGYAVCDFANSPRCNPSCHCQSSFLALASRARCSIAEVVEVPETGIEEQIDALAWYLVKGWGAPSWEVGARHRRGGNPPHRRGVRDARARGVDHGEAHARRRRRGRSTSSIRCTTA